MKTKIFWLLIMCLPFLSKAQKIEEYGENEIIVVEKFTFKGEKYYIFDDTLSNIGNGNRFGIAKGNTIETATRFLQNFEGSIYFIGKNADYMFFEVFEGNVLGRYNSLISSDGTQEGTTLIGVNVNLGIEDRYLGPSANIPDIYENYSNKELGPNIVFSTDYLWKTDGTASGTIALNIDNIFTISNDFTDRNIYYTVSLVGSPDLDYTYKIYYINATTGEKSLIKTGNNYCSGVAVVNGNLLYFDNSNYKIINSTGAEIPYPVAMSEMTQPRQNLYRLNDAYFGISLGAIGAKFSGLYFSNGSSIKEIKSDFISKLPEYTGVTNGDFTVIDKYEGYYYCYFYDGEAKISAFFKTNGATGNYQELDFGLSIDTDTQRPSFFPEIRNGKIYTILPPDNNNNNYELLELDIATRTHRLLEEFSGGSWFGKNSDNNPLINSNFDGTSYKYQLILNDNSDISINKLSGGFYNTAYTVPLESTIHQYFIIKDIENDTIKKGEVINYKLSNSTQIRHSLPSDSLGLLDLNITLGGENINSSSDDWLSGGTVTVSFVSAVDSLGDENTVGLNGFRPFTINVINKAEPVEKEFGLVLGVGIATEVNDGAKINIGGLEFEAGTASLGLGASYNPSATIVPDNSNPNLWQTKLATPISLKQYSTLGPTLKGEIPGFVINGGATVNSEIKGASVDEQAYSLNVSNIGDGLFLGSQLFAMSQFVNPATLLLSNFLYRLSAYTAYAQSQKKGLNIGLKIGASAGGSVGILKKFNNKNTITNIEFGIGLGVYADASLNYELSVESLNAGGTNLSITYSANRDYNGQIVFGGNGLGLINDSKTSPFAFQNNAKTYTINLKRSLSSSFALNRGAVSFSSDKFINITNQTYKQTLNNTFDYSKKVVDAIGNVPFNFVSEFINKSSSTQAPMSMVFTAEEQKNGYNQIVKYNEKAFSNRKNQFGGDDIKITTTRDITKVSERTFPFELVALAGIKFEIGYTAWNRFGHPFKEYKYSKDVKYMLRTIDYADINTNLELPDQDPFYTFMQTLVSGVESSSADAITQAKSFVKSLEALVEELNEINFSNSEEGNVPQRLLLNATPQKNKESNSTQNTTPSVFTFTIPSGNQAFDIGNKLYFSYYYPENQLNAVTLTDTFKIITETYFLSAKNGETELANASNGNFTINTQFSSYELELAGLPSNLVPQVLFLPNGATQWEVIGLANVPISFSRLGTYAIGVSLLKDIAPPIVSITPPSTFTYGEYFSILLTDNLSGIDWSKTYIVANGQIKPFIRIETTNEIRFDVSNFGDISGLPDTFELDIYTIDLSNNKKEVHWIYPCSKNLAVFGITGGNPNAVTIKQARENISLGGAALLPPPVSVRAGNSIIMNAGFSVQATTGGHFKAEIGGCQ